MRDAHDTHCCIHHGCKYGDDDCPVANGVRKQCYLCESCGLETEGYYGEPERSHDEQQEFIDALWDQKQNPMVLSAQEKKVATLAKRYGKRLLREALDDVLKTGMDLPQILEVLDKLKHIQ